MKQLFADRERITAIASTLVAIAILAAGVTAEQSRRPQTTSLDQLESDLRFQLHAGFRHDDHERLARLEQVEQVLDVWRQSTRTEADGRLLADWLLQATICSMPTSHNPLPAAPMFGKAETKNLPVVSDVPFTPPSLTHVPLHAVARNGYPSQAATAPMVDEQPTDRDIRLAELQTPLFTDEKATINLTELAARIAGYHDSLDRIENALVTFDGSDLGVLIDSIEQLDEMIRDFRFVKLYYGALSDDERNVVRPPRPMTVTLVTIERQLTRREQNSSRDFLGDFDLPDRERPDRERVDELRKQLASISNRVE